MTKLANAKKCIPDYCWLVLMALGECLRMGPNQVTSLEPNGHGSKRRARGEQPNND